ncbi:histidine kinase dimerization/phospho-acceptor domain-containing protein [Paenibacillus sp. 1P07SE]|uniref:histidine kinase dimerization/phospho-acceptor domain-containing protein n=1 Tax=Paenibacillus sp. 1P07SE TaxID=3132209 RepID=UPI0039A778EF
MHIYKTFFINLSILVTCSYLFNLIYKNIFATASWRIRQSVMVVIFIISGWLSMIFSVRVADYALFDLRAVPLIFGALVFRDPRLLLLIGAGIAASRYTVTGLTSTAVTGSINILLLGVAGAMLVRLFNRKQWDYRYKAFLSIIIINTTQVCGIALFGAIPTDLYLNEIAPFTYPTSLVVSGFFVFIMRDFYKEQMRGEEIHNKNTILQKQAMELKKAKENLEQKTVQLQQSSKYKSEFIANMSHELKTPLNSILLMSDLIKDAEEEECAANSKIAAQIHQSGTELLRIIEDILDLSKLEAGKMELAMEPVSLQELGQLIYYQHQELLDEKGLNFRMELQPGMPETITTDPFRLNQLIRILLLLALKHTEEGSIRLTLMPDNQSGWIIIRLADTGIGLPPEHQRLLSRALQDNNPALLHAIGSGGLGLSVCQQLSLLLRGRLSFSSTEGAGSAFSLHLPAEPELQTAEPAATQLAD